MPKDARYKAVKSLIEAGGVKQLKELFLYIPRKTVYTDMGMNYARFKRLEAAPEKFTIEELYQMSVLFDVKHQSIIDLVLAQMSKRRK